MIIRKGSFICCLLLCGYFNFSFAQEQDSVDFSKKKKNFILKSSALYTTGMTALSVIWYKESPESFRWFNDAKEWKQMDKAGHFYSSFQLAWQVERSMKVAGYSSKQAAHWGSALSFIALSSIEILDGFSPNYGASFSDIGSNLAGSLFYLAQYKRNNPLIVPKFSFRRTPWASKRPELLGSNLAEEILKDYNGQTYWLSLDMDQISSLPKWINFSLGYGAYGMKFARDEENLAEGINPYRRWFLGMDIDLSHVRSRHRFIRSLLSVTRFIRLPAPSFEYTKGRLHFRPLCF